MYILSMRIYLYSTRRLVDVCAHECLNNKLGKYFNIHHAIKISRCLAHSNNKGECGVFTPPQQQQQQEQQLWAA